MKKITKKHERSQVPNVTDVFAELDEDILALGPRLFPDEMYDNDIVLSLEPIRKRRDYDKNKGQKDKA